MVKKGAGRNIRKFFAFNAIKLIFLLFAFNLPSLQSPVQEIIHPMPSVIQQLSYKAEQPPKDIVPKTYIMQATAYTHTGNPTASGAYPTANHTIAADTDVLPIGTAVMIDSQGPYVVEDTGRKDNQLNPDGYYKHIQGNRIDIFMETKNECIKFGKKEVQVTVLKEQ